MLARRMTTLETCAKDLVAFVNQSPSPFHAVQSASRLLSDAGFVQISERDTWNLERNKKYFFTRNQSTIVAFAVGGKFQAGNGVHLVAAHTDSPHPKVKPISAHKAAGYLQVGVELYGGGLWHTWFDRDLSIAGRVVLNSDGQATSKLVQIDRPIMRIPTLAIHLCTADERGHFSPNNEDKVFPILATAIKGELEGTGSGPTKHHPLLLKLLSDELNCKPEDISDFELSLYDNHKSVIGGACNEFVFSARLDNLASSFCALKALIESCDDAKALEVEDGIRAICLFDHEECGSQSTHGAASSLLERFILRVTSLFGHSTVELEERAFRNSFVISADMAHAVHPNYEGKHEKNHRPQMHKGVVIKYNSNQRYATNSATVAILRAVASQANVPLQDFVVRNDSPCGTTVGPILAANTGVRTIDVGAGQLSMHSIREMCATDDVYHYFALMKAFFGKYSAVNASTIWE